MKLITKQEINLGKLEFLNRQPYYENRKIPEGSELEYECTSPDGHVWVKFNGERLEFPWTGWNSLATLQKWGWIY
jgi:hypothetical protein